MDQHKIDNLFMGFILKSDQNSILINIGVCVCVRVEF
jgi:hypothetical protein